MPNKAMRPATRTTSKTPTKRKRPRKYPCKPRPSGTFWSEEEIPLFPKVNVASTFFHRMRGLLGRQPSPQLLMIAPCRSIHTYGMRYPIHVAFFDRDGIVLSAERSVPPGTRRSCEHACGVLEMPAIFEGDHWFVAGDHLRLAPPDAGRP